MKRIATIFAFLFLLCAFSAGQVQQWSQNGNFTITPDPYPGILSSSDVYLTSNSELIKMNANGTVAWGPFSPPPITKMLPFVLGFQAKTSYLYTLSGLGGQTFITLYRNDGSAVWSKTVSGNPDKISLDPSGNIYVLNDVSTPQYLSAYDVNNGAILHQFQLPSIPSPPGLTESNYLGIPYFDLSGNIWLVAYAANDNTTTKSGTTETKDYIYTYLTVLTPSGQFTKPSTPKKPWITLKNEIGFYDKKDSKGNENNIQTSNALFSPYGMVNGILVLWNQYFYKITQIAKPGSGSYVANEFTEGRILTINAKGGTKMFLFKGKGVDVSSTGKHKLTSDLATNALQFLAHGGDPSQLYIGGNQSNGKSINGIPGVTPYGTLMKFDVAKVKPIWTLSSPTQPCKNGQNMNDGTGRLLVYAGGNIFVEYNTDGTQVRLIDFSSAGTVSGDWLAYNGDLYVNFSGPTARIVKYSLPSMAPAQHPVVEAQERPIQFALNQNYPNPFNPTTTISFELPVQAQVTLKVYNMLGQEVAAVLNSEQFDQGEHEVEFNAANLASGVYTYCIEAIGDAGTTGTFTQVKRMMIVK